MLILIFTLLLLTTTGRQWVVIELKNECKSQCSVKIVSDRQKQLTLPKHLSTVTYIMSNWCQLPIFLMCHVSAVAVMCERHFFLPAI